MKKISLPAQSPARTIVAFGLLLAMHQASCNGEKEEFAKSEGIDCAVCACEHCANGQQDCGEEGVDCGADCTACDDPCENHCSNCEQDCGEDGVDCGADCALCPDSLDTSSVTLSSGLEATEVDDHKLHYPYGPDHKNRFRTALALNGCNMPTLLYVDDENTLRATEHASAWTTSIASPHTGGFLSAAVDTSNAVHVAYSFPGTAEDLYYATNDGGTWTREKVDTLGSVGLMSDLALDSRGNVHISHWSWDQKTLRYSTNETGIWTSEALADGVWWAQTSVAIDLEDHIHLAYYDSDRNIRHLVLSENGEWWADTIGLPEGQEYCASARLRCGPDGALHVVCQNNDGVYYANTVDSRWGFSKAVAPDMRHVVAASQLAMDVDSDGSVAVAYVVSDRTGGGIGRLRFATNAGGSWQSVAVDDDGLYRNPSIAVRDGVAHIAVIWYEYDGQLPGARVRHVSFDVDGALKSAHRR